MTDPVYTYIKGQGWVVRGRIKYLEDIPKKDPDIYALACKRCHQRLGVHRVLWSTNPNQTPLGCPEGGGEWE